MKKYQIFIKDLVSGCESPANTYCEVVIPLHKNYLVIRKVRILFAS